MPDDDTEGLPDLVRFETPRGEEAVGWVVDDAWDASVTSLQKLLVVEPVGTDVSYRVAASEVTPA
jgi:hypothetical protein